MRLIIDTNILIAALIKDSFARKLILFSNLELMSPELTREEINVYKELILDKSGLSESEFKILLSALLAQIKIIPETKYHSFMRDAEKLIGKIDIKDVPFVAAALSLENDGIWSDDRHFEKQNKIKIFKTKDIAELLTEEF